MLGPGSPIPIFVRLAPLSYASFGGYGVSCRARFDRSLVHRYGFAVFKMLTPLPTMMATYIGSVQTLSLDIDDSGGLLILRNTVFQPLLLT